MNRPVKIILIVVLVLAGAFGAMLIAKKIADNQRVEQRKENTKRVEQMLKDRAGDFAKIDALLDELKEAVADDQWHASVRTAGGDLSALKDPEQYLMLWRHEVLATEGPKGFGSTDFMLRRKSITEAMQDPWREADFIEFFGEKIDGYVAMPKRKFVVIADAVQFTPPEIVKAEVTDKDSTIWRATPGRIDFVVGVYDRESKKFIAKADGYAESSIANPNKRLKVAARDVLGEDLRANTRAKVKKVLAKLADSGS